MPLAVEFIRDYLNSGYFLLGLLWIGLGLFALDLILLMETRWGQTRLLRKCLILSMFFHALLVASWMIGMPAAVETKAKDPPPPVRIRMTEAPPPAEVYHEQSVSGAGPANDRRGRSKPWETFSHGPVTQAPQPVDPARQPANPLPPPQRTTAAPASVIAGASALARLAAAPPLSLSGPQKTPAARPPQKKRTDAPEAIEVPAPRREAPRPLEPIRASLPRGTEVARVDLPDRPRVTASDLPASLGPQAPALPRLDLPASTTAPQSPPREPAAMPRAQAAAADTSLDVPTARRDDASAPAPVAAGASLARPVVAAAASPAGPHFTPSDLPQALVQPPPVLPPLEPSASPAAPPAPPPPPQAAMPSAPAAAADTSLEVPTARRDVASAPTPVAAGMSLARPVVATPESPAGPRFAPSDLPRALVQPPPLLPLMTTPDSSAAAQPVAPQIPPELKDYISGGPAPSGPARLADEAGTGSGGTGGDKAAPGPIGRLASAGAAGGGIGRQWAPNPALPTAKPRLGDDDEPHGAVAGPAANLVPLDSVGKAPEVYRARTAPDRQHFAEQHGATPETETAVRNALQWLGTAQSPDGRWSARQHEGGRDSRALGQERLNAGLTADTGITGLALLSLLASGHTPREGLHRETVRRGIDFLVRSQSAGGSLAGQGNGNIFDSMYCHGIATFALSEALGMTGDESLRSPVQRAIHFTLTAQDPKTGGWRYSPGMAGDTSQTGWQFMALKSAELAGLPMPEPSRNLIIEFLRTVASGRHSGLAAYRPGDPPTRTMTAEAILCWQFLGMAHNDPAGPEAGDFLLGELPSAQHPNYYYWYYGTLASYQLQGEYWQSWNDALRQTLVATQHKDGPASGSWDPDPLWGAYGGRIYSTSLAALCLEVYYRFLPLYREAAGSQPGP